MNTLDNSLIFGVSIWVLFPINAYEGQHGCCAHAWLLELNIVDEILAVLCISRSACGANVGAYLHSRGCIAWNMDFTAPKLNFPLGILTLFHQPYQLIPPFTKPWTHSIIWYLFSWVQIQLHLNFNLYALIPFQHCLDTNNASFVATTPFAL